VTYCYLQNCILLAQTHLKMEASDSKSDECKGKFANSLDQTEDTEREIQKSDVCFAGEVGGTIHETLVSAAIDFGTTHFGYAFKYKDDDTIFVKRGEERQNTCLLLNPDKTFAALGNTADEDYYNLDPDEQQSHYFFRQFKMRLYEKKLSRQTQLFDESGKPMSALEVFSIALVELKRNILYQINSRKAIYKTLEADDVQWTLTIPAIWTDEARQFMREAATTANMNRNQLVLEPEAAALFALEKRLCLGENFTAERFGPHTKYIVADIGGGTVDMCVHEILDDGKVRELYRATGCDAGGRSVNENFLQLFKNIFGASTIEKLKHDYPHEYQELVDQIEETKCSFTRQTEALSFTFDTDMISLMDAEKGRVETVEKMILKLGLEDSIMYKQKERRLQLFSSEVKWLFDCSICSIIKCLKTILIDCPEDKIKYILLVGGYSQSDYLRSRIVEAFPDMKIIHVDDGRLAVVKGAVMAETRPHFITERRSRFSYGFAFNQPFNKKIHPLEFKFESEGTAWCRGVFEKMIEAGQVLKDGQQFSSESCETCQKPERKHTPRVITLWRSPLNNPTYCFRREDQCEEVGRIEVAAPSGGWPRLVTSVDTLVVGETEFTMKWLIKETGEEHECTIDFL